MIPVLFPIRDSRYPDHKTFVIQTVKSYFVTIDSLPTQTQRVAYTASFFQFLLQHLEYISSPKFGSTDGRKRMIVAILSKCDELLTNQNIQAENPEHKKLYKQFRHLTQRLMSRCRDYLEGLVFNG